MGSMYASLLMVRLAQVRHILLKEQMSVPVSYLEPC